MSLDLSPCITQYARLYLHETMQLFTQLWASLQSVEADGGQTASGLNWSAFDWAEHCLKQERKIKEDYNCAEYVWRQWTVR